MKANKYLYGSGVCVGIVCGILSDSFWRGFVSSFFLLMALMFERLAASE